MPVPGCSNYPLIGVCQGGGEVWNDIRGLHLHKRDRQQTTAVIIDCYSAVRRRLRCVHLPAPKRPGRHLELGDNILRWIIGSASDARRTELASPASLLEVWNVAAQLRDLSNER